MRTPVKLLQAQIEQLKNQFHDEMLNIFDREGDVGLCSTRFLEGVREYGGFEFVKRLLKKAESDLPKNTFSYLRGLNRLDLTAEYWVGDVKYRDLFDPAEIEVAEYRLKSGN
jgi:hypothetical protein